MGQSRGDALGSMCGAEQEGCSGVNVWGRAEGMLWGWCVGQSRGDALGSLCGVGAHMLALSGQADPSWTAPSPSASPSHSPSPSCLGHNDAHPRQCRTPRLPRKVPVAQVLLLHHFPTTSSCNAQAHDTVAGRAPSVTSPVPTAPIPPWSLMPTRAALGTQPLGTLLVTTPQLAGRPESIQGAGGCAMPAGPGMCVAGLA